MLCTTHECEREASYIGSANRGIEINVGLQNEWAKWNNEWQYNHTLVGHYIKYMQGGGYVLTLDIAQVCITCQQRCDRINKALCNRLTAFCERSEITYMCRQMCRQLLTAHDHSVHLRLRKALCQVAAWCTALMGK